MTRQRIAGIFKSSRLARRTIIRSVLALSCAVATAAHAGGPSYWTQTSESDFRAGTFVNSVATNLGDVKLSRAVKTLLEQDPRVSSVFALAQAKDGTIYAGTGPQGVVLKINDDKVDTFATIDNAVGVFSLAFDEKGRLLIGTGGDKGHVYRIDKAGEKPVDLFHSDDVQYVWAMKVAADGTIYAATGPNGQLIEIDPAGKSKVLYDSTESNLLSLAYDGKSTLFVGTDPNGIIYRVDAKTGKAFVLYDADETEVTCMALDAAGNLYAGTAQATEDSGDEAMATEQTGRPEDATSGAPLPTTPPGGGEPPKPNPGRPEPEPRAHGAHTESLKEAPAEKSGDGKSVEKKLQEIPGEGDGDAGPGHDAEVAADAKPTTTSSSSSVGSTEVGETGNAIYRVDPQGFVTEVFRHQTMFLSMVENNGSLLVGTGSEGSVYSINPTREENVIVARLDPKQVTSMLAASDGRVILGLANAGGIAAMSPGYSATGIFTSDVQDAKQVSRFGAIEMHGSLPAGTSVGISTRSGNLKDGNTTEGWSAWSEPTPANTYVSIATPPGRFFQYKLSLASDKPDVSPAVTDVKVTYQVPNLAPTVKSIKVEAAPAPEAPQAPNAEPTPPAGSPNRLRTVTWEATDPNDDALKYTLSYRKTGSSGPWIVLKDDMKESTYTWDTRTVADGRYELKVVASDAEANPVGAGKTASRVSDPLDVDNTAPVFDTATAKVDGATVAVEVKATDKATTVAAIAYAVDSSKDWQAVGPEDGIFDSPTESSKFTIKDLKPGPHQLAIKATDALGNDGYTVVMLEIPAK